MERSEGRKNRIGGLSKNQMAGLYDLEETIGEGHYAVVKMARHVFTGEKVAVKVIDKMKLDAATRLQMLQEVRLMKLVQHPYVVRLYEVIDTQTKLYLVLEFADGGDMYDYIMKHEGGLDEATAKKYFRQIVTAIQYCHKLHVVHRDLKPENVVFFEKLGMVKLTDFGFSNKFNPGQRLQTSCGSLAYSAPEILLGDSYDAPAVDIWSLGVILYMLVCGTAPFQEANDSETLTMIMDCKYSFPSHISQQCKSLISRMLQREPELRASLEDIVSDSWLNEDESTIRVEELFPLVAREHLTDEEHSSVLQKMVNGAIAHRDDIIAALDRNEYNHITATYFLLAERKLRVQRSDQLKQNAKAKGDNLQQQASFNAVTASAAALSSSPLPPISIPLQDPSAASRSLPTTSNKRVALPPLSSPIVDALFSPSEAAASLRRKCTIVQEEEEEAEDDLKESISVCDDSFYKSKFVAAEAGANLDLALCQGATSTSKPLMMSSSDLEATPAPFPVSSQIGTGLSRQGSLRRSETSGSESPVGSITPPGSAPSSSQGSPARYKPGVNRKLNSNLVLNQIHEEAEVDLVDNFPSTSAGAAVMRRIEQRRRMKLHKARTTSCSSSEASDEEGGPSSEANRRPLRPEKTPTPPPLGKDPHEDSSDNDPSGAASGDAGGRGGHYYKVSRAASASSNSQATTKGSQSGPQESQEMCDDLGGGRVMASAARRHRPLRVRQSRSLNRISELHVVADFSGNEDMLTKYLEAKTRSRDDSLTSSDGEFDVVQQPPRPRSKVNLRLLEQRLNKIQEEVNNAKNEALFQEEAMSCTEMEISRNGTIDYNQTMVEDKENKDSSSTKSEAIRGRRPTQPKLHRAHSCGSLFSLKERALLRKKLSSHVTAAFWDILSQSAASAVSASEAAEVIIKPPPASDLTIALNANPLSVIQGTSRCCNLC